MCVCVICNDNITKHCAIIGGNELTVLSCVVFSREYIDLVFGKSANKANASKSFASFCEKTQILMNYCGLFSRKQNKIFM